MTILTHFATSRETGYAAVEVLSFRGTVASLKAAAVSQQFPVDIRPLVCFLRLQQAGMSVARYPTCALAMCVCTRYPCYILCVP